MFLCWVEIVGQAKPEPRWVFLSFDRVRYNGGIYAGETSPEAIRDRVGEWWQNKKG
jgi:hypothetical protein